METFPIPSYIILLLIYFLLMSFTLALSTGSTGVEIIFFDSGAHFRMNDFRSLIALKISLGVAWGALLVPTWRTILSGFFLKCGITKNLISLMVAPGNVRTFINFCLDILNSMRPDRIELPIIQVVPWMVLTVVLIF